MSRESELDQIIRRLIGILVKEGQWTAVEKREYDLATMERSRRLSSWPSHPRMGI